HQPISIDEGAITVAQNGEIYNYVELQRELESEGVRLQTACDTEVIAHVYARARGRAFRRLRGMFAAAVWDPTRQELVLARDRAGKKPLYFFRTNDELLFASEAKAILAVLERVPEVSGPALLSFLTFGCVSGDDSIFRGMRQVAPGELMTISAD